MNTIRNQIKSKVMRKVGVYASVLLAMLITLSCALSTNLLPQNAPTALLPQNTTSTLNPSDTPTTLPPTDSVITVPAAFSAGLIAYVGVDGNIYTIDQGGNHKIAITQDAVLHPGAGQVLKIYQYPTWAPDGQTLAFIAFSGTDPTQSQASLIVAGSDGKTRVEAFSSQDTFPFYLFWSPNSDYVSFLSNDPGGNGLILQIAAAKGGNTQMIGTGQPYYWDWSPDNKTIIVHTGGDASGNPDARMAHVVLGGSVQKQELDLKPGLFQAPDWSPGGDEIVMATENSTGAEELILTGKDGTLKSVLAQVNGQVAFAWSPKGDKLAYLTSIPGDAANLQKSLVISDATQPTSAKEVANGVIVAYFWSPDGQKVAYFELGLTTPGPTSIKFSQNTPLPALDVQLYDLVSGQSKKLATFEPTDSFLQVLPYFDQYQRSATIWSPDSKNLLLAGTDSNGNSGIFVAKTDGSKFQKIADGDVAFWSWK